MKRTKSMIYNPTEESRELFLVATNDGDLYRRMITPIINNLRKKAIKGTYDKDRAVDAYYYAATEASNQYKKDFGYSFSVQDRFTAAVENDDLIDIIEKLSYIARDNGEDDTILVELIDAISEI